MSLATVVLGHLCICLPFAVAVLIARFEGFDRNLEEASADLGETPLMTFWRVTLPGIRWGLLYGVSLTFARAIGEFGAVLVVSGGVSGLTETSTVYIFRTLDDRNEAGAYAMALTLAALSFVVLVAMEWVRKDVGRQRSEGEV